MLVPWLSRMGDRERALVLVLLDSHVATPNGDVRRLVLCSAPKEALAASGAYAISHLGGVQAKNTAFLWNSRAPSRVKFFPWLLSMARIHTRDVMLRKTIVSASEAGCPACSTALKTADHPIFRCPFACELWANLRLSTSGASVRALHLFDVSPAVGEATPDAFMLLCCWHLWKHRCLQRGLTFPRSHPQSLPG